MGRKRLYELNATERVCRLCDRTLPVSRFNPDRLTPKGIWSIESRCHDCKRAYKYGTTRDKVLAMLLEQGHACGICKGPLGQWHTDHDHVTGKVRGILCHGCNVGIGMFKDDPAALRAAADYLS